MKTFPVFFIILLTGALLSSYMPLQNIPTEDLKYLALKLKDPNSVIGVFYLPDAKDPLRKVKATGDYPESDSNYIRLAVDMNILKLNSRQLIKGEADSLIFLSVPFGGMMEETAMTFYSFPGTERLMILNKGFINNGSRDEAAGWLKDVKNL